MADLTQTEDYKVLQAMRTEISGLVESQNRLDSEIKKLEEDKVQAELSFRVAKDNLDGISGEWSARMREIIDREDSLNQRESTLATNEKAFEAKSKEREEALNYLESQVKSEENIIQQKKAESDKLRSELNQKEQHLSSWEARLNDLDAGLKAREQKLVQEKALLEGERVKVQQAEARAREVEAEFNKDIENLRTMSAEVSKDNSRVREEFMAREKKLVVQEAAVKHREEELDKREATMDTRINKSEADAIRKLNEQVQLDRQKLSQDKSDFEVKLKEYDNNLHNLTEQIKQKEEELTSLTDKVKDIERREKGVADTEAALIGREKLLMFDIAKFKKRVKDARMEDLLDE